MNNFDSFPSGFVFHEELQLSKAPIMNTLGLAVISDMGQILHHNPLVIVLGISNDLFANAVVGVGDKSSLSARDLSKLSLTALCAIGLKTSPCSLKTFLLVGDMFRRVKLLVRSDSNSLHSQVNSETATRTIRFGRWECDRDMQVELILAQDKLSGTNLPLAKLPLHLGGHLKLTGHSTFRANGQRGGFVILADIHRPSIVSDRRILLELMSLFRITSINLTNLRNCVDNMLSRKSGLFSNQVIARVMNIVLSVKICFKSQVGESIARLVKLTHRCFEFFRRAWQYYQLGIYRKVNHIHLEYCLESLYIARDDCAKSRSLKFLST